MGREEEHGHCTPSTKRPGQEVASLGPALLLVPPLAMPTWEPSQAHGSLLDAIHGGQPTATQGIIKKSGE